MEGVGVVRIDRQDLTVELLRFGEPSGLMMPKGLTEDFLCDCRGAALALQNFRRSAVLAILRQTPLPEHCPDVIYVYMLKYITNR